MRSINIIFTIFAVSVLFVSAYGIPEAEASHFRHAHINWEQDRNDPSKVTFGGTQSWAGGSETVGDIECKTYLYFGDDDRIYSCVKVEAVNPSESWFFGKTVDSNGDPITHTYEGEGPWIAEINSGNRIFGLENTRNTDFVIQTQVNFENGNTQSPKSVTPPIVIVPQNEPNAKFVIPAVDIDGDSFKYSKTINFLWRCYDEET